jgi:hypothetical protein
MSLATPAKETKRKRKSTDIPSQLQEAKRLKSEELTPKTKAQPKDESPQPNSNKSLPKEVVKQMAMELTEKPFSDPKNQSQTLANQAWKKQNVFRKRNARTAAKREQGTKSPVEEEEEREATEEVGEETATKDEAETKPRKEKKLRVDKRTKRTKEDIGSEDGIADALLKAEEGIKKEKKAKPEKRAKKTKEIEGSGVETTEVKEENALAKPKSAKKDKKSKRVKIEEEEDMGLIPQGLIAERVVANRGNWAASKPAGGRFINHDPIFSIDEK